MMVMIINSPTTLKNWLSVTADSLAFLATVTLPNIPLCPVVGPASTSTTTIIIAKNTNSNRPSLAPLTDADAALPPITPPPRFALIQLIATVSSGRLYHRIDMIVLLM